MATCSNCGRTLSCGCQRKTASDGRSVCGNCISQYETSIKPTPKINNVTSTQTWGRDRYNNLNKFIK
jgi:hypothetical protein